MANQPPVGAIVDYVLGDEWIHKGEARPALIVRVWGKTTVNLLVFLDGDNDKRVGDHGWETVPGFTLWKTSVVYDDTGLGNRWNYGLTVSA